MSEQTTNPVDGEAMPEVVDAQPSESEILDAENTSEEVDEAEDQAEDDGLEDTDYEGKTYKLPKELKDALLRQADYTKKTQEVAELRKDYEARQAEVQKASQRSLEFAQDIAQLGALNAKLEPFNGIDWGQHLRQAAQRGPDHAAMAQADYSEWQLITQQRDAFARSLEGKVKERQDEEQRATAKQIADARAEIAKKIPGYNDETLNKLTDVGSRFGFSSEEIRQAEADPRSILVLHRLAELEAAQTKQSTTQKLVQQVGIRPAAKVAGAAPAARSPERMSTDEWMRHRNAQVRKAR